IERPMKGRPAVPRSAKGNPLGSLRQIRLLGKVICDQLWDIDKLLVGCCFSCKWMNGHIFSLSRKFT
ncbi:MAG: hypothetical protein OEM26_18590, partial [Saprospiraceae bacterium]|nr:hypothetical protein [Saprospiraceae bacterium]